MIDTDKYEGHTEGPWELITNYNEEDWDNKWVGSVHLFTTLGISFDVVGVNETDVQLMADAPLLLAEVMRLREGILNVMAGIYDNMYDMNQALDRVILND